MKSSIFDNLPEISSEEAIDWRSKGVRIFSKEEINVRLMINDYIYLEDMCELDKIESSHYISGNYYGSSTFIEAPKISGHNSEITIGDIWHPKTGFNKFLIILRIKLNDEWKSLFEKEVDFKEIKINFNDHNVINLENDFYKIELFFRDLHRLERQIQISGCRYTKI